MYGTDFHQFSEHSLEPVDLRGRGTSDEPPTEIRDVLPIAGKYFKRWDAETGTFVSNNRELYPED
jgi:F-box protein 21